MSDYIHGFSEDEQQRLLEQASFLEPYLFPYVDFTKVNNVLEIGCGVGAQTRILLKRFPNLQLTSVDHSEAQLSKARLNVEDSSRVTFQKGDASHLQFENDTFDGGFICWLLEHVKNPVAVLKEAYRVLKPGAHVYAFEVMNFTLHVTPSDGSYPRYWDLLNLMQEKMGGDPHVGTKLGNFFAEAGFSQVKLTPHAFHFSAKDGKTFHDFIDYWHRLSLSAAPQILEADSSQAELIGAADREFRALKTLPNATFYYACMVAIATV